MRQVGSYKFVVPPTRERSKVRNNARPGKSLYRAATGCQRDRGPSVSGGVQRNPFQGGSFGQLLRGGSTPRFFSQIRSVGSKPPGWQGTARKSHSQIAFQHPQGILHAVDVTSLIAMTCVHAGTDQSVADVRARAERRLHVRAVVRIHIERVDPEQEEE